MQAMLARTMDTSSSISPNHHHHHNHYLHNHNHHTTSGASSPTSSKAEKDVAPFLKNLRLMLDVESDAVLRWTPNGRAFEIHDMEQMMASVLPKYFKHRKYTSFQRQLNYFNFRKWTKSKATVCTFSNDFFLRDQPELAWRISRKKSLHHGAGSVLQQLQQQTGNPRPSPSLTPPTMAGRAPWVKAESVAISLAPSRKDSSSSCGPFPSPTDQDTMLKEQDQNARSRHPLFPFRPHYPRSHQLTHHQYLQPQYTFTSQLQLQQQSPEALDWIDCLLPPVDRIEDDVYAYMYAPPAACTHTLKSAAAASSSYDFV